MIADKKTFRQLWLEGKLGNRPRVWTSLADLMRSQYRGSLSLRIHTPSSPHTRYGVHMDELCNVLLELEGKGVDVNQIWFNESAPDDRLILQGEYFHGQAVSGAFLNRYFMYSWKQEKMKPAMLRSRDAGELHDSDGIMTDLILQSVMMPNSWDEFLGLRDRYPDHTIELGVYDCEVGTNPGCNHLIWEVRMY